MSEFIGSRISLISKSDIRYVGTLHEINSENSTVALQDVTSFGTEGRRGNPDDEVAASNELYEYIVFRGSDVKDLRIEESPKENKPPQVPNDPAILGSGSRPSAQQPGQQPLQSHPSGPPPNFQQPPPYPYQQYGQYPQSRFGGPGGGPLGGPPGRPGPGFQGPPGAFSNYPGMPYGAPPGWYPPPSGQGFQQQPGHFYPHPQMPPFNGPGPGPGPGPGARPQSAQQQQEPSQKSADTVGPQVETSTPGNEIQKPAVNLPVGPAKATNPKSNTATPAPSSQPSIPPPPPIESKPDTAAALAPPAPAPSTSSTTKSVPTGPKNSRVIPAIPLANNGAKPSPKPAVNNVIPQKESPKADISMTSSAQAGQAAANAAVQYQNSTQAATAAVAAAMAKLGPMDGKAMDNLTRKVNEMRTDDRIRHSRQPGTGGYAAGHRGDTTGYRGGRGGRGRGGREPVRTLEVPTTDFDFESANAQFKKQDLVKEAIASGSPSGTPIEAKNMEPFGGDSATNGSADVVIAAATGMYNKSSFFDNISSEAKDREEASDGKRPGQEFRNEERRRNMETFGLGSVDGQYRGGFRGRGRGRGGFRGGYGRGGYPRGGVGGGRDGFDGAGTTVFQQAGGA